LIEQVCAACDKREPYIPTPWFNHIWFLWRLKRGGYPFSGSELSLDEWLALADLDDLMTPPRLL
jgi:hypothetical protein